MPPPLVVIIHAARLVCALAPVLLVVGCGPPPLMDEAAQTSQTPGPLMRPGDNCLRCHSEGSQPPAPPWTAAGTVYASLDAERDEGVDGVTVVLTDKTGKVVSLVTNEAGNFHTAEKLEAGFTVALEREGRRIEMPFAPPAGSCNACHSLPPVGNAMGRIYAP